MLRHPYLFKASVAIRFRAYNQLLTVLLFCWSELKVSLLDILLKYTITNYKGLVSKCSLIYNITWF